MQETVFGSARAVAPAATKAGQGWLTEGLKGRVRIPQWVRQQAVEQPEAIAVEDGNRRLSRAGLVEEAGAWSERLLEAGMEPEKLVAVAMERSVDFVSAALAVWQSGAAYLPLDPGWPVSRLKEILRDAGADLLLTRAGLAPQLAGVTAATLSWEAGPATDRARPEPTPVEPHHLAYVIYTSGSTGKPRGVEITHANLENLVGWHRQEFGVTATDRASFLSPVGFDAAVWEMWPNLAAGASLHIPPVMVRYAPEALRDWLLARRITVCFVTSVLAERLLALPWPATAPLRLLLTGADTLHRRPRPGLPFHLVNNYGPTECTVLATSGEVVAGSSASLPDLGRPIANTRIAILDEQRRRVAWGDAGEIHIAGAGVGRGYRNRPELTATRFLPDPEREGTRMYRTGDRGRMLDDGSIEFLGRMDDQIKLNGYRIEPQEIVSALHRHAAVARSVVKADTGPDGATRLVAWLQLHPGFQPTRGELIAFLRESLPDYMIPSVFVVVPSFSMNANGKVDEAALPSPAGAVVLPEEVAEERPGTIESQVAEILAGLLQVEQVAPEDNFFYLGGHSLLGTQLISRVREKFGVRLTLRTLFDHPTAAELAVEIDRSVQRARLNQAA